MNVETLNEYILNFEEQVVESGFLRDVTDFSGSLPNNQSNIISLREIAQTIVAHLKKAEAADLPSALTHLFPAKSPEPFTAKGYLQRLESLLADTTVQQPQFFEKLTALLASLSTDLVSNDNEAKKIRTFIAPYTQQAQRVLSDDHKAIVSIIFKDERTTHELKEFSRILNVWNRYLPLYHQLVTNTSPPKITIVEVQNGSIDLVINLDAHVALNFADLIKIGLTAYAAYIAHKKQLLTTAIGYFGNTRLEELDNKKGGIMLENIRESVAKAAKEQHSRAKANGAKVDNPSKVIDDIAKLITGHIVRGNEVKILALPESGLTDSENNPKDGEKVMRELKAASASAREALKGLPANEVALLLKEYAEIDVESEPSASVAKTGAKHEKSKRSS